MAVYRTSFVLPLTLLAPFPTLSSSDWQNIQQLEDTVGNRVQKWHCGYWTDFGDWQLRERSDWLSFSAEAQRGSAPSLSSSLFTPESCAHKLTGKSVYRDTYTRGRMLFFSARKIVTLHTLEHLVQNSTHRLVYIFLN